MNAQQNVYYNINLLKFFDIKDKLIPTKNVLELKKNNDELSITIYDTIEGNFDLNFSAQDVQVQNKDKTMKFDKENQTVEITTKNAFESIEIPIEEELNLDIEDSQIFAEQVLQTENAIVQNDREMFVLFLY